MEKEKYQPSETEVKAGEDTMTERQKRVTRMLGEEAELAKIIKEEGISSLESSLHQKFEDGTGSGSSMVGVVRGHNLSLSVSIKRNPYKEVFSGELDGVPMTEEQAIRAYRKYEPIAAHISYEKMRVYKRPIEIATESKLAMKEIEDFDKEQKKKIDQKQAFKDLGI